MSERAAAALRACGAEPPTNPATAIVVTSPIDGEELLELAGADAADAGVAARAAASAFAVWRSVPPGERAAAVAAIGRGIAARQPELAELIGIETGKPVADARAEVEAASGFCALAADAAWRVSAVPTVAGLPTAGSRSRRPLGPVAVLGSFALPLLGWASVAPLALACGCPVVCLPEAPLLSTATAAVVDRALRSTGIDLPGLHAFVLAESDARAALADDSAIELVVEPDPSVANVALVSPPADLSTVAREATVATVAGAGRSPAALRLLLVHESLAAELEELLVGAFAAVRIGNPSDAASQLGPLRDLDAYRDLLDAVHAVEAEDGLVAGGELRPLEELPGGYYAEPTLIRTRVAGPPRVPVIDAPVLYFAAYRDLDEALAWRDASARRWSGLFGGEESERNRFLAAPGADRGFVAVGGRPREADLAAPDEFAWLAFTRAVAFGRG